MKIINKPKVLCIFWFTFIGLTLLDYAFQGSKMTDEATVLFVLVAGFCALFAIETK